MDTGTGTVAERDRMKHQVLPGVNVRDFGRHPLHMTASGITLRNRYHARLCSTASENGKHQQRLCHRRQHVSASRD